MSSNLLFLCLFGLIFFLEELLKVVKIGNLFEGILKWKDILYMFI